MISEELWGVGEPRGPQYMNVNWIGPAISQIGTEEQRKEYFGPIAAGEAMWCQGFSEPDAGLRPLGPEDLGRARRRRLHRQRPEDLDVLRARGGLLLPAGADGQADNPRRGISVLLVPMDLPGIEVREIPTLGVRHLVHEIFFQDVAVPVACRLGEENEGWNIIRHLLASERVGNARHEWVDRSLDKMVDEAIEADGVDTADPRFWETLGRAAAWTAASRVLNYAAVQAWSDDSKDYPNLAATYRASMAQMELGVPPTRSSTCSAPTGCSRPPAATTSSSAGRCRRSAEAPWRCSSTTWPGIVLGLPKG